MTIHYSELMSPARLLLVLAAALCTPIIGQEDLWRGVRLTGSRGIATQAPEVTPTLAQRESITKLLKTQPAPWQSCDFEDPQREWLEHLSYRSVPLSPKAQVLLAEAGGGCARGGQGSNGAMWLVRFDGRDPVLLASPQQEFNGFLYSIERATFKGYRDVITGWHIGGGDTGLNYFRFDGASYRRIGRAILHSDEHGSKVTPQ